MFFIAKISSIGLSVSFLLFFLLSFSVFAVTDYNQLIVTYIPEGFNQTIDGDLTVVDSDGVIRLPKCVQSDISFESEDMQINGDIITFERDGFLITLNGADTNNINKFPKFKNNILTINSSIIIKNATIAIPHCGISPFMVKPILYLRNNSEEKFVRVEPYCNENGCFNNVEITPTQYIFNVEHFTDYTISTMGDFETLSACLKFINNTADTCVINQAGYYDINKWQINSTQPDFNKQGLVLAYDFDVNHTSSHITTDTSDSGNHGTVGNATWNQTGYYSSDYKFFGLINSKISAGNHTSLNITDAITISAWVKFDSLTGHHGIVSKNPVNDAYLLWRSADAGHYAFAFRFTNASGAWTVYSNINPSVGVWYNVVGTYDSNGGANNFKIYLNGVLNNQTSASGKIKGTVKNLTIGSYELSAGNTNGLIDQVRVWNRSLSQSEIEQQYAGDVAKYNLSGNGIILSANGITLNLNGSELHHQPFISGGCGYHNGIIILGNNSVIMNSVVNEFNYNYYFYYQSTPPFNVTVVNSTSMHGCQMDWVAGGNHTFINFTGRDYSGMYINSINSLFQDITLNNCSFGNEESCISNDGENITLQRVNIILNPDSYLTKGIRQAAGDVTIKDSYIEAQKKIGIWITQSYAAIINTTIENSKIGIDSTKADIDIINNTFNNISRQAIRIDASGDTNSAINITNNTILNSGNGTRDTDYGAGYSPMQYNGVPYNGTVAFNWNSGGTSQAVTQNGTKIAGATGTNYWRLLLYQDDNSPILGCGNYCNATLYIDDSYPLDCAGIVSNYGGACVEWYNAFIANGADTDYTWNTSITGITVINDGANSPYLMFRNDSLQTYFPVEIITGSNWANITGNTFETTDGRQNYGSMNVTADASYNTNVWLNNFYSSVPVSSGNAYFCIDNGGNLYEQSLNKSYIENVLNDCGPANITYPIEGEGYGGQLNITWKKQSSQKAITYSLFYSNDSGINYYHIDDTSSLNYLWTVPSMTGVTNIIILIQPYDDLYNTSDDIVSLINKQIDVYNLSIVYGGGQFRTFKFKIKNIDSQTNSINYTSFNTSENNINTSEVININSGKEIFTFVDYNYIGTGVFEVTAYANTSSTSDKEKINITI